MNEDIPKQNPETPWTLPGKCYEDVDAEEEEYGDPQIIDDAHINTM